jgi:hypothetical protein
MSTLNLSFFILSTQFDAIQGTCTLRADHEVLMSIDVQSLRNILGQNEIRFVEWYQDEVFTNGAKSIYFMSKPQYADFYDQDVVCKDLLEIVDALSDQDFDE